jgi:ribonucleoside-diphosphate reductase alpha chain
MGWADALVLLGISYRSTEAIDLIHQIGTSMQNVANNVSTELGELLGCYTSGERRNENLITIAPTGTLSYFAGCSGGIEPNFGWDIVRETEAGETVIKHPLYEKYVKGSDLEKDIAHSISAYWQIEHQATWQLYVDNAVSKTINLPANANIEDFYSAYRQAYERDCKGVTIYRDGSKTIQTLRHGESVPIDHCRERPAKVYERKSGCGTIYVIPSEMPGNMAPWDTFAITSGGCAANSEAIGRLISGWLQDPSPAGGVPARIGHILHSVDCPKCNRRDGCDGNSCADIIGRVIVEHYLTQKTDDRPVCPNCKHHLNFGSGCNQGECPVCGWSGCN